MLEWQILVAWIASSAITVGTVVWILAAQFSNIRNLIFTQVSSMTNQIMDKLEYHERHDDARFAAIQNDVNNRANALMNEMWALKLSNASKEAAYRDCGKTSDTKKKESNS